MVEDMKTLPERVRWAREKRRMSHAELDEVADLSCGHSAKIEKGDREHPSASTMSKLAYALKVDIGWLINGGKRPEMNA
jgi:transcriptional regulator with XRE-family HTH domain